MISVLQRGGRWNVDMVITPHALWIADSLSYYINKTRYMIINIAHYIHGAKATEEYLIGMVQPCH